MRLTVGVTRIEFLSSNVFERRTSKGSEPFSLLKYLDATKFVLLSFYAVIETICHKKKLLKITSQECNKSTSGLRASLTRKPRRCLNPLVFRAIFVFYEFMFSRWYWGFLNSHSRKELTRTTFNCSTEKMRLHPPWVCTQVTSYLHLLEYDHHLTRCSSFLRLITRLIFLDSRPHIPHRGPHVSIKI